jgi:hypothetical protein
MQFHFSNKFTKPFHLFKLKAGFTIGIALIFPTTATVANTLFHIRITMLYLAIFIMIVSVAIEGSIAVHAFMFSPSHCTGRSPISLPKRFGGLGFSKVVTQSYFSKPL